MYGIEVGRGVAAILVVLSHISLIMLQPRFYGVAPWHGVLAKFGAGVDFFFVLSGFIIAWVHWDDIGHADRIERYALRRIRRIYPAYWCVLLPLSLAYFLAPSSGLPSQHDPWNFVTSFLLLPYPEHPILGVAWTLVYEMIFYVVFGAIIVLGRRALWGLAVWGLLILVTYFTVAELRFPFTILLDVRNLEFLMGIGTAVFLRRHATPLPGVMLVGGIVLFFAQLLSFNPWLDDALVARLGFGLASVMVLIGTVELERAGRVAIPAPFRELGAASYSIYLVHGVAISFAIQVVTRVFPRSLPLEAPMLALVVAGVGAGIVYHRLVEVRVIRWTAGWRLSRRRPMSGPA